MGNLNYIDCFRYALAWKKRNKIATAQIWACFAFELLKNKTKPPKYLNEYRNKVFHGALLNEKDFNDFIHNMKRFIRDCGNITIAENLTAEDETDLTINVHDLYYPKRSEVGHFVGFEKQDFVTEMLMQKKVWALKYDLDERLINGGITDMETGLISEFTISSEWIWLPIGLKPMRGNDRIKKPVISILILRDGARIYFDLPTATIDERINYYKMFSEQKLTDFFRVFAIKYPTAIFFNTNHYSLLEGTPLRIVDWLAMSSIKEYQDILSKEISFINKKVKLSKETHEKIAIRSSKMLFGVFYTLDEVCKQKVELIDNILSVIKIVKPLLHILSRRDEYGPVT